VAVGEQQAPGEPADPATPPAATSRSTWWSS